MQVVIHTAVAFKSTALGSIEGTVSTNYMPTDLYSS